MKLTQIYSLALCMVVCACGDDDVADAADMTDAVADVVLDETTDVRAQDAIDDAVDDMETDAEGPAPGFGSIVGTCGRLVAELESTSPSYFELHFDFATDGYDDPDERAMLTEDAQEILETENSGGSSEVSEAFAMEVLARCESATLLKTETEIQYEPADSDKTDILVEIASKKLGVSVVRAFAFPPERDYTLDDAMVIRRKLDSILESTQNVVASDRWVKQSLVVMAYAQMHADVVKEFYETLPAETKADTAVYVVVTDGADDAIY